MGLLAILGKSNFRLCAGYNSRQHAFRFQMALRTADEIMQRRYSRYCRDQRRRNLRIAGIRPVLLAIDDVLVNGSVKRLLHLACRPGKLQHGSPFRGPELKAVGLQPSRNRVHIGIARAELFPKFLRGHPLVIAGRMLVLLIVKQFA